MIIYTFEGHFKKGDLITFGPFKDYKVVRYIKEPLWGRLLRLLGFDYPKSEYFKLKIKPNKY